MTTHAEADRALAEATGYMPIAFATLRQYTTEAGIPILDGIEDTVNFLIKALRDANDLLEAQTS